METTAFVNYLIEIGGQKSQSAITRMNKCEKIEKAEGNLDKAYDKDRLHSIYHLFDYTREDVSNQIPQRHHVRINGRKGFQSIYEGTKDYQSSLSKYIEFKDYVTTNPNELSRLRTTQVTNVSLSNKKTSQRTTSTSNDWPKWDGPNEDERLALSRIITRYMKFLHPNIVETIAEDNAKHMSEWSEQLEECGISPMEYLWDGSPCCFPGIRRHSGTIEINAFRNKDLDFNNAIALDDNSYPKQLWSYVFRDTVFSMRGPNGYQLAHLVDHKDVNNRLNSELESESGKHIEAIPGLFTSAANAAYVPLDFLRPTDFESDLRGLLQRKAAELYSDICEPLPPGMHVAKNLNEKWAIKMFDWAEPVGTLEYMRDFLRYRENKMKELFADRRRFVSA